MRKVFSIAAITAVTLIALPVWHFAAHAHDHSRPELNRWFEGLKSGKGPCCSGADGTAISDADWEMRDGHYRVRIHRQWWDVPEQAVIKEPNRARRRWSGPSTNGRSASRCGSTSFVSCPEP
jgi:hypothetical protein